MAARPSQPAALTIAGSDSSGGAGLQADLRTLARLGVHGASVVTCVTAQNPDAVTAIHPTPAKVVAAQLDPPFVAVATIFAAQLDSVFGSLPIRAVKIGMLYSRAIIDAVAGRLAKRQRLSLVVDPVMLSSSGTPLLKPSAATTLANRLFPLAKLVTPNLDEAAALAKRGRTAGFLSTNQRSRFASCSTTWASLSCSARRSRLAKRRLPSLWRSARRRTKPS